MIVHLLAVVFGVDETVTMLPDYITSICCLFVSTISAEARCRMHKSVSQPLSFETVPIHELRAGYHVKFPRWLGLYYHHAIVLDNHGNGTITTMEWSGDSKSNAIVAKINTTYDQDVKFKRAVYDDNSKLNNPPELVLKRAKDREGDTNYNLITNNCESLAIFCKTGEAYSTQSAWVLYRVRLGVSAYFVAAFSARFVEYECVEVPSTFLAYKFSRENLMNWFTVVSR